LFCSKNSERSAAQSRTSVQRFSADQATGRMPRCPRVV
jgi:hypothetical protein